MSNDLHNYTEGRLYTIARDDPSWELYIPGVLRDERFVIMGRLPPGHHKDSGPQLVDPLICLYFSKERRFESYSIFPIPYMIDPNWSLKQQLVFGRNHRRDARNRWMADLGMTIGTIQVHYFSLPELMIGIADWPNHLFRERHHEWSLGRDLAELDEEDERHGDWIAGGFFVFYWGSDFYMNPDGTIGAS